MILKLIYIYVIIYYVVLKMFNIFILLIINLDYQEFLKII